MSPGREFQIPDDITDWRPCSNLHELHRRDRKDTHGTRMRTASTSASCSESAVNGARRLPNNRGFISARRNEKARHEAGGDTTRAATLCARCREVDCNGTIVAELSSCSVTVLKDRADLIMASVIAMMLWPRVCADVGPPVRGADCGIRTTEPMTRFVPDGYGPAGPRR